MNDTSSTVFSSDSNGEAYVEVEVEISGSAFSSQRTVRRLQQAQQQLQKQQKREKLVLPLI